MKSTQKQGFLDIFLCYSPISLLSITQVFAEDDPLISQDISEASIINEASQQDVNTIELKE